MHIQDIFWQKFKNSLFPKFAICTFINLTLFSTSYVKGVLRISDGLPWWLSGKRIHLPIQETDSILGWKDPVEKEMATHSDILAWEIS